MNDDFQEFQTKQRQVIQYIENLSVGSRISVRKIAQELDVSDGTAYKAIKEAEALGIVSTKERIGTVRVEKKVLEHIDKLTFSEVVNIVDGEVVGGAAGLHKTLNKFVIGAMQLEAMKRYIEPDNLLIVGNRTQAHLYALARGAGVLVTGGFQPLAEAKDLADDLELPIIVSSYDTFTVATLINRAIDSKMIKKKIMLVQDIVDTHKPLITLHEKDTLKDMQNIVEQSEHTRFPVVDDKGKPIGMITTKDILGAETDQTVDRLMSANPMTVGLQASLAYVSHTMVWEGIELLPVIANDGSLIGVISREDVMKTMQYAQTQPQNAETFEDQLWYGIEKIRDEDGRLAYRGSVSPQMTNHLGMVSEGVLTTLMSLVAMRVVLEHRRGNLVLDSSSNYYMVPIPLDSILHFVPTVIEMSRRYCKIEVEIYCNGSCMAKSIFSARLAD